MNLRPYQVRAVEQSRQAFAAGARGVCLVLPTGAGKTVIAAHIARQHISRGGRVVVFCHREELIRQTHDKLSKLGLGWPVVRVESVQTMVRRDPPPASLVIFDECHHFGADIWGQLPRAYSESFRLGLTATPQRTDGKALEGFDTLVVGATVAELTELGHLVPCRVLAPNEGTSMADPVEALRRYAASHAPAVVFCANVPHAQQVAEQLGGACIEGSMRSDEREYILREFDRGNISTLTNVYVLTEGWDAPRARVAVVARGCTSAAMWLQMCGRVLRPFVGKEEALVLDCKGSVHQHGLPADERVWSLQGRAHRLGEKLPAIRQCPQCGGVSRPFDACPYCSYQWPPPEPPKSRAVEMRRVDSTTPEGVKRSHLNAMLELAQARGHKPGWACHLFRARWGHWPERSWMP